MSDYELGISPVTSKDLLAAARSCVRTLAPVTEAGWGVSAGDLEWDCRRTLDHVIDALLFYATHLASRATRRLPFVRNGERDASVKDLLTLVEPTAAVLAAAATASPPGTRAFHPSGMADPEGFLAMGCNEILIHTHDIAAGLGLSFHPAEKLSARVLRRLFPWAPRGVDPWPALLWANGRVALPDHPRLDADWYWHSAPLEEWNGEIKKRTAPPGWT